MTTETRPPKGYRWGEVTIEAWELVDGARVVVPAVVPALLHECGYLGLHKPVVKGYGLWTVTHLPSGKRIWTAPTQAMARQCIGLLLPIPGLSEVCPSCEPSKIAAILSTLASSSAEDKATAPSTPRTRKAPTVASPSSFSPVFPGIVPTPATRAAANRAALALGELWTGTPGSAAGSISTPSAIRAWNTLEEAAAVAWREEIVVRVTQPPRAILLESDIPPRPAISGRRSTSPAGSSTIPTLRDGTPATPGEFRRRYQQLLDLGDRLRAGSLRFQTLYAEGEAEGWTGDRLDRWERIDERFRALVCEGWMIWSGAAFCFDCAPVEFQRNVVAKLGFIGSRERGWHELGIKTFLRWPEIAAVQPLRRELREKIGARL